MSGCFLESEVEEAALTGRTVPSLETVFSLSRDRFSVERISLETVFSLRRFS